MTATRQGDDATLGSDIVLAVGLSLSAATLAAAAVPVRRGVDEPAIWLAAGFALLATVTFLSRRHGFLERRIGGPVAAGSGVLVVLSAGYAINRGVLGSVVLPGLEWSISLVFTAFLVGAGIAAVGVADYAGISGHGLKRRTVQFLEMLAVGSIGLIAMFIAQVLLASPAIALLGSLSELQWMVLTYLSFALGLGSVAFGYLRFRGYDLSYIDLEVPTIRTVLWTVGGLIVLFGILVGGSWLMNVAGVEAAGHGTVEEAEQNPELLVVIVPAMILIVGPFEELLYRNVIQKSLYETFSRYGAVVVASVVFAFVHVLAYATAGPGQVLASLAMIFGLSLVLGMIYERTENLLVPALIHGVFNAVQFSMLYFV